MGFILGYENNPGDLVDYNPDTAAEHLRQLEVCARVLADVLAAQRDVRLRLRYCQVPEKQGGRGLLVRSPRPPDLTIDPTL